MVAQHLGGYVRLSIEERREAALELKADGASNRDIGRVLGDDEITVRRDGATNVADDSQETAENGQSQNDGATNVAVGQDDKRAANEQQVADQRSRA